MPTLRIGVDVGATGAKAAVVEVTTGQLLSERLRFDTPNEATAIFATVEKLITTLQDRDPRVKDAAVGIAFPSVIKNGQIRTAANIDAATIGRNVEAEFADYLGVSVIALNDADAAALAEVKYGLLSDHPEYSTADAVMVLTLGTGIGSGYVYRGQLIPNFELGHLELDGVVAESRAAASAIVRDDLDWPMYAERVNRYLAHVHRLFSPDVFVLGGGVSREAESFLPLLQAPVPVEVATLRADAGIIGAAAFAAAHHAEEV